VDRRPRDAWEADPPLPEPAPDDDPALVRAPIQGRMPAVGGTRPLLLTVLAFVILATVKPWGEPEPAAIPPIAIEVTPQPTATPLGRPLTAGELVADFCMDPVGWRVYTEERWGGHDVRSWKAVEPIATATGPLDPEIPAIPVPARLVRVIGWCAPRLADGSNPRASLVHVWEVGPTVSGGHGATSITLQRLRPPIASPLGAVYQAPGRASEDRGAAAGWPSGHFVFQVASTASPGVDAWFALEIMISPELEP
jgi:hypothetical protein